jgi:hypothetical protein
VKNLFTAYNIQISTASSKIEVARRTVGEGQNRNGIGTVLPNASMRIIGLSCAPKPPSHAYPNNLGIVDCKVCNVPWISLTFFSVDITAAEQDSNFFTERIITCLQHVSLRLRNSGIQHHDRFRDALARQYLVLPKEKEQSTYIPKVVMKVSSP